MKSPAKKRNPNSNRRPNLETKTKFGIKLLHHRHSGRRVHREHTTYAALFFILTLAGAAMLLAGVPVNAGPPQSDSGDIDITAIVPGDPPSEPAVFTEPKSGMWVKKSELFMRGTCEPQEHGRVIEIFRDNAFAGSAQCTPSGEFSIIITLVPGKNIIIARTVDWVGQYGPDSKELIIFYDVPIGGPGLTNHNLPPFQLFTTDHILKGIKRNKESSFKYQVNGGKPAYAVTVDWGDDSKNDIASISKSGEFNFMHAYKKAGLYVVSFRGIDFYSNKASFQVLAVVNENATPPAFLNTLSPDACENSSSSAECTVANALTKITDKMWPAFIVASLMTFSFWLGEKIMYLHYFKHKLFGRF